MLTPRGQKSVSVGLIIVFAVLVSGCANRLPYGAYEVGAAFNAPYHIDSGDQLRISVFGQEDLTRIYSVDGSGKVAMPLIGAVKARGRTTEQLEVAIAGALAQGYIRKPDVQVEVQTYRPFYILGEVRNAGQYPYVNGMTVNTAVAIAGGYTYRADRRVIEITRRLPAELVRGPASPDTPVMPGDTITVHERFF